MLNTELEKKVQLLLPAAEAPTPRESYSCYWNI